MLNGTETDKEVIKERMKAEFSMSEEETEAMKDRMRRHGRYKVVAGWIVVVVAAAIAVEVLAAGQLSGVGSSILLVSIGAGLIVAGNRQRKNAR